jgi:hypothetical protein
VYRDFNAYAFDYFITRTNVSEAMKISAAVGRRREEVMAARQRLDLSSAPRRTRCLAMWVV